MVQCVSVGVGVTQLNKEDTVLNISKHLAASSLKDLKIRQPRQADSGGHSDPLDWLRASVPGEPGQDYPVLSAIQVRNNTIDICPKPSILYLRISSLLCRTLTFPVLAGLLEVTMPIQTSGAKLIMSVSRSALSYFFSIPDVHSTRLSYLNLTIWLMAEMRILEIKKIISLRVQTLHSIQCRSYAQTEQSSTKQSLSVIGGEIMFFFAIAFACDLW